MKKKITKNIAKKIYKEASPSATHFFFQNCTRDSIENKRQSLRCEWHGKYWRSVT